MKLKDKGIQPPMAGLPESYHEWWDLGDGYEIYICRYEDICSLGVEEKNIRDITYDIAKLLNVDVSEERLVTRYRGDDELYVSMGIDCVVLNYRKPENYKELLKKIEVIVNKYFKHK